MRVLITGSRSWADYDFIEKALAEFGLENQNDNSKLILVSGNCPEGADLHCEMAAKKLGWEVELYPANWGKFGKSAGFLRNKEMVDTKPDICIGFIHNNSKGGSMTVRLAREAGVPTIAYKLDDKDLSGGVKRIDYRESAESFGDSALW